VTNGCVGDHEVTGFYLPYFTDADISDIVVPTGWSYSIDTSDNLFGLANAGVIDLVQAPARRLLLCQRLWIHVELRRCRGPDAISLTTNGVNSTLFGDPLIPEAPTHSRHWETLPCRSLPRRVSSDRVVCDGARFGAEPSRPAHRLKVQRYAHFAFLCGFSPRRCCSKSFAWPQIRVYSSAAKILNPASSPLSFFPNAVV